MEHTPEGGAGEQQRPSADDPGGATAGLGGAAAAGPYDATLPLPLSVAIKPFPWPAVDQDLGSATAAVFFNLLMVCFQVPFTVRGTNRRLGGQSDPPCASPMMMVCWVGPGRDVRNCPARDVLLRRRQVYAFLSPARGVVVGIVREKELRLREGMRLMGE